MNTEDLNQDNNDVKNNGQDAIPSEATANKETDPRADLKRPPINPRDYTDAANTLKKFFGGR